MTSAAEDLAKDIELFVQSQRGKCDCDFCSGKKSWDDNWCPRCGEQILEEGKWWENLDICGPCEVAMKESEEREAGRTGVRLEVGSIVLNKED